MNDNERGAEGMSIREEAERWLVRLDKDKSAATQAEFDRWVETSPEHRREFEWIEKVYAGSEMLVDSDRFGVGREDEMPVPKPAYDPKRWLMMGTAAAAAAAVLLIAFGAGGTQLPGSFPGNSMSAQAAEPLITQRGEIRSFRLADGSTATLDTESRVEVAMTKSERHLRVSKGRARFAVAPDPRPFRVQAGAGEVVTSQGEFDVAYDDDENIVVRLISGNAAIRPVSKSPQEATLPRSLQQDGVVGYRVGDYRVATIQSDAAATARQDWPSGWADYRSIRLDTLVAEANRYADKPIILDDRATASLVAVGRFRISKTDVFVERIAELFDLSISHRDDGIHLRKR